MDDLEMILQAILEIADKCADAQTQEKLDDLCDQYTYAN